MNTHMIRLLALAMILSGSFSSCVEEEKPVPGGQQPIEIGLNEPTRSTPIVNVAAINGHKIGLIALYPQTSTIRFNSSATVSGSKATLDTNQHWPTLITGQSNHKLNFVSWYPYNSPVDGPTSVSGIPSTTESNNKVTMNFTEKLSMTDQKDFMVATHTPIWKGAVDLAFHHALTRIRFKFNKETASDANYTVTGIKLKNVAVTSTLTVTSKVTALDPEAKTPVLNWPDTPTATNEISWTGPSFEVKVSGSDYYQMAGNADDSQNTNSFMTIPMKNLSSVQLELTYTPSGGTSTTVSIPLNTVTKIPSWGVGQNIEYAVCVAGGDVTITPSSSVVKWEAINIDTDVNNYSKDYILTVNRTNFTFPKDETTHNNDNLLKIFTTYAGGWTASFTSGSDYFSLVDYRGDVSTTGDKGESVRYIKRSANNTSNPRTGILKIKADEVSVEILVTQTNT